MHTGGTAGRASHVDAGALADARAARGVTEIRVHGVGGSPPEQLLGSPSFHQVAGDRIAGFYRTDDARPGRHTEAYCWGGLTSGGRIRALWLVLLPFTLANIAGWAAKPRAVPVDGRPPVHGFRVAATRLAGLSLTIGVLLLIAMLSMDVLAYQCGAQPSCAGDTWWLAPLTWGDLSARPVRRLVVGSLPPLLVIGTLAILSYTSRSRYEQIPPPYRGRRRPAENTRSAVDAADGLADPAFWSGRAAHARLSRIHLTVAVSLVTVILAVCGYHTAEQTAELRQFWPGQVGVVLAVVAAGAAIALLGWDWRRSWPSAVGLAAAIAGFAGVAWAAWIQPAQEMAWAGQTPGVVAVANGSWITMVVLLFPLFLTFLGSWHEPPVRTAPDGFRWVSPFTILAVGVLLAHLVLLGVIIFVAALVSPVTDPGTATACPGTSSIEYSNESHCPLSETGPVPIVLPRIVQTAVSYFVWFGLAWLIVLGTVLAIRYWRAGRGRDLRALPERRGGRDDYDEQIDATTAGSRSDRSTWLHSAAHDQFPDIRDLPGWRFRLRGWLRLHLIDRSQEAANATSWTRTRARREFLAGASPFVASLVTGMVATALAVAGYVWYRFLTDRDIPAGLWAAAAVTIAVAIPPAIVGFVLVAWRDLSRRRVIGTVWDVGTFWPRSFHPFAPPCYAERAVPELTRRVWWLNDNNGQVVLAAHSQGSIIAAASALRNDLRGANGPRFSLVTFGSPLRKLYGQAFPAYWSGAMLDRINEPDSSLVIPRPPRAGGTNWRNLYYFTDYIGGAVGIPSVDRRLCDPATSIFEYGQPPPKIVSHTGYWSDPQYRCEVTAMIARAEGADPGRPDPGRSASRRPAPVAPRTAAADDSRSGYLGLVGVIVAGVTGLIRLVLGRRRRPASPPGDGGGS